MKRSILLTLVLIAMSAQADETTAPTASTSRTPVPDARPLLITALQSSSGEAHGTLTGEVADAISKRFAATSPIFIDVTTERRLRQSGCSRLKVVFWQDGVQLPGASAARKQSMEMGINYCLDGLPPRSPL